MLNSRINQLREAIGGEWRGIRAAMSSYQEIAPGLYTFPIKKEDGSNKRLHLRVEEGGQGILFVDVTDVIHLNKTALIIAKMALDGVRPNSVISILQAKYKIEKKRIKSEVKKVFQVVRHLENDIDGCKTCALAGLLDHAPLFSLRTNAPYKVDIALTYGCNNQCPHCYNEVNRFSMPSLPLDQWYRVLDRISELGIPHVILTGGEATLHPNFLEIVRYADQLGMIVGLNSNGRYLGHVPFMEKAAQAGLNHVQITLGSCFPEIHDAMMGANSFRQTVSGIRTAISLGVHVITNTTLMRSNMDHIPQLLEYLYDLGVRTFAMNGMIYAGGGFDHPNALHAEELPPLIELVKAQSENLGMRFLWYTPTEYCRLSPIALDVGAKKCNAGEYSICIEPNGNVIPCQSYYVAAGNILTDDWNDIWQTDLFVSFRDRENYPEKHGLPTKCWQCPDLLICGAGCRIEREADSGIRVAEIAGGGCLGCSTYFNPQERAFINRADFDEEIKGSYVPFSSQADNTIRSTGRLDLVQLDQIRQLNDDDSH